MCRYFLVCVSKYMQTQRKNAEILNSGGTFAINIFATNTIVASSSLSRSFLVVQSPFPDHFRGRGTKTAQNQRVGEWSVRPAPLGAWVRRIEPKRILDAFECGFVFSAYIMQAGITRRHSNASRILWIDPPHPPWGCRGNAPLTNTPVAAGTVDRTAAVPCMADGFRSQVWLKGSTLAPAYRLSKQIKTIISKNS